MTAEARHVPPASIVSNYHENPKAFLAAKTLGQWKHTA
jgi:hypothetical protein